MMAVGARAGSVIASFIPPRVIRQLAARSVIDLAGQVPVIRGRQVPGLMGSVFSRTGDERGRESCSSRSVQVTAVPAHVGNTCRSPGLAGDVYEKFCGSERKIPAIRDS